MKNEVEMVKGYSGGKRRTGDSIECAVKLVKMLLNTIPGFLFFLRIATWDTCIIEMSLYNFFFLFLISLMFKAT